MTKKLSDLLGSFEHTCVLFDGKTINNHPTNPEISDLFFDSRDVTSGSLFFALPGTHTTGNAFIPNAIKNGAAAIVFQDEFDEKIQNQIQKALAGRKETVAFLRTDDSRKAMAPISATFYDNPSKKIAVIGVTGTEGKSSTVSFIWQLLRLNGHKAGFISTVQYSLGEEAQPNPQHTTTPESPIIQKYLAQMVNNGCEYAVIETSSHGLSEKLNRTGNIDFDCGVFMNVTLEHLEFHKTFEQYRSDKANLFRNLDKNDHKKTILGKQVTVPAFGVVNLEDESASYFINSTKHLVMGFTTEGKAGKQAVLLGEDQKTLPPIPPAIPYIVGRNIASASYGLSFSIAEPNAVDQNSKPLSQNVIHIKSSLPGAFNAYNIMASLLVVSRITSTPMEKVAEKVKDLKPIKGRMTIIDKNQPFEVIVDYAHTPSSFQTIFPPIRRHCNAQIIALFGSGGERDTKKRPLQGEIAAKFCDTIILTDEDPRQEESLKILNDIAEGAKKAGKIQDKNLFLIPDRPTAIRKAFTLAGKGDIVLLLGKSHENSIIYKDGPHPYDEISEAKKALEEMGY
ncbi:Mur ligase family protein [Treponema pectinovorum]|uniref:Mur ligase family protein n=1 Tax=Treponema pectinovorum TaxID=164 RepID=UPI0011C7C8CD|nr:UDP-N-acetylmuramyl-tripeptide synthetase [Treponema pectinovorum]